jgi:hypothetical protein
LGKESSFWDWVRAGIHKIKPHYSLVERVENGVVAGMADVNYVICGCEGWIELKAVEFPARRGTRVLGPKQGLAPEQINWHLARGAMGSRTFVLVKATPFVWLVRGAWARSINDWDGDELCEKSAFWVHGNWKPKDWSAFVGMLMAPWLSPPQSISTDRPKGFK